MIGEDLAVAHDHDERLQGLFELLANVSFDVETVVGGERGAEIGGDQRGEPARGTRRHRAGDAIGHPEKDAAFRRQHDGQEGDETERNAPIQAAIPVRVSHQTSAAL